MEPIVIKPVKFILVPSGTYNKQYHRPLRTNVDEFLIKSLFEKTNYGTNFTPTAVAGIASTILSPSTKPTSESSIINGWGTQRYRFVMILEVKAGVSNYTQIATGYTDYLGASFNHLDPNMKLYFNSFQTFTRLVNMTEKGLKTILYPYDLSQLVRNEVKTGLGSFKYDHMNPFLENQLLRPQDIFHHLTLNMYSSGNDVYDDSLGLSYNDTIDTRSVSAGNIKSSERKNSNPTTYISSLLTGLNSAKKAYGDTNKCNVYLEAASTDVIRDKDISNNKTIRKISSFFPDFSKRGYLTLAELNQVIPELPMVTKPIKFGSAKKIRRPVEAGDSEQLGDATRGAHAAAVLHNALPELMIDSLLGQITFMASNNYADGRIRFTWTSNESAKSLCDGIDPYIDKFTHRLTNEFLYDMSNQGATRFDLTVFADLFDDIQIHIGFDGSVPEPYVIPAFCDSLFTSIIGDNGSDLSKLSTDMQTLAENVCATD